MWGQSEFDSRQHGQMVCLGPYDRRYEADDKMLTAFGDNKATVHLLPTSSMPHAKSMLKAHDLAEGKNLEEAMEWSFDGNKIERREP